MTARGRLRVSAAAFVIVLFAYPAAWAGEPTDQLRSFFAEATRVFGHPETEEQARERLGVVHRMVNGIVDFREAAKLSLGRLWHARTATEQEEFVRLFAGLLDRTYISRVTSMARLEDGGVRISYVGESIEGDHATVSTTLATRDGRETPIDYQMVKRGDRWAVRDIVIDGLSLAANYRAQFARVVRVSSYRELVKKMHAMASGALSVPTAIAQAVAPAPAPAAAPPSTPTPAITAPASPPPPRAEAAPPPTAPTSKESSTAGAESAPQRENSTVPKVPAASAQRSLAITVSTPAPSVAPAAPEPKSPRQRTAAVAPAERAPVAPKTSTRSYWVQVGAFRDPDAAARLASRLLGRKLPVSIGPVSANGVGTLSRVLVGPFPTRSEAVAKLHELEGKGYSPFIAERRD